MLFILDQQAKFWAGMEEMKAGQADLQSMVGRVIEVCASLAELQRHSEERQQRLEQAQLHLDQKVLELADAQKHTDERLSALITVVDGLVPRRPQ